ncbi:tripartite tricarboxylate transporter TctB family protein [Jiangella asiatica]|uniref:Tripartite tricarboxylate transporter TctB family protein n=1 Tax=Jiangella asiatica TaxID=2530372 RepID=A0A4V2Z3C4_9ACTN|nr:tripartite tricarboxylate transporter TctB family protein [Jiangella asiatica]TDE11828.1 tripartite tricarboxylate transporter TctB family protein [Jiangella asiatica]
MTGIESRESPRLPLLRGNADAVAGLVVAAFGVFFAVAAVNVEASPFANTVLEPGDLPLVVAVGLIVAGLALTVQSVVRARRRAVDVVGAAAGRAARADPAASDPAGSGVAGSGGAEPRPRPDRRDLLVYGALLVGYVLTLIPLGYIASTFVFILVGSMYHDRLHLVRNVVYAVVFSMGVFVVFNYALGVILPPGVMGFMP